jgi:hypothetical protein
MSKRDTEPMLIVNIPSPLCVCVCVCVSKWQSKATKMETPVDK